MTVRCGEGVRSDHLRSRTELFCQCTPGLLLPVSLLYCPFLAREMQPNAVEKGPETWGCPTCTSSPIDTCRSPSTLQCALRSNATLSCPVLVSWRRRGRLSWRPWVGSLCLELLSAYFTRRGKQLMREAAGQGSSSAAPTTTQGAAAALKAIRAGAGAGMGPGTAVAAAAGGSTSLLSLALVRWVGGSGSSSSICSAEAVCIVWQGSSHAKASEASQVSGRISWVPSSTYALKVEVLLHFW
jgi:hypothetical protein